jgi:hypothetical protein
MPHVTLGCFLYSTISARVPFRPTTVQVSNLTLVETKMDYSVVVFEYDTLDSFSVHCNGNSVYIFLFLE